MPQTRAQLRTEAQQRANQENKTLVGTTEWDRYINLAIAELYDLIVSAHPHYYFRSQAFSLISSNLFDLTTLTGGFYKLRGLDYNLTPSRPLTVRPFNFAERNRYSQATYAGNYTVYYTPPPPVLTTDSDPTTGTLDTILDVWSEFIPVTAAIQAMIKEETNPADLAAVKAGIIARVRESASNRDAEPAQAADLTLGGNPSESWRRYAIEGTNLVIYGSDFLPWF